MTKFLPLTLRTTVAGLIGAVAGIHFDLWEREGYRHIPTVGPLFLLNSIAGALLALAVMGVPKRLLALAAGASAGFAAATLAALIFSLNGGLFGFSETTNAPLFVPALAVEAATVVAASALSVWTLRLRASGQKISVPRR